MVKAEFSINPSDLTITHAVTGHAGLSTVGKDIVCAAASMLTQTFAQLVYDNEDRLTDKPTITLENGNAYIYCQCKDTKNYKHLCNWLDYTLRGYRLLAINYPEYVDIVKE